MQFCSARTTPAKRPSGAFQQHSMDVHKVVEFEGAALVDQGDPSLHRPHVAQHHPRRPVGRDWLVGGKRLDP